MTAKRTPIRRPPRRQITPAAIAVFRRMQALAQQCICGHSDYCPFCLDWWELHEQLSEELHCKPWQWPCIVHPDDVCPYPPNTGAATWWPHAQALYRALNEV